MSLRVTSDRQTIHDAAGLVGERHLPGARVVAHDEEGQTGPWVGREAESRSQPMSPAPRRAVTGSNSRAHQPVPFDQRRTVRRQPPHSRTVPHSHRRRRRCSVALLRNLHTVPPPRPGHAWRIRHLGRSVDIVDSTVVARSVSRAPRMTGVRARKAAGSSTCSRSADRPRVSSHRGPAGRRVSARPVEQALRVRRGGGAVPPESLSAYCLPDSVLRPLLTSVR